MKTFFVLLSMACSQVLFAQDTVSIVNPSTGKIEKSVYVDQLPKPGYDVNKYIAEHIKQPKSKVKGKMEVSFLVRADGTITDVKLLKGLQTATDAEVLRVIRTMLAWQPAQYRGKAVPSAYTLLVSL